jgi:hypothetical protein
MSDQSDQSDEGRAARDDEIERTTDADSSASRLFDVRRVIGALFTLYGVLVLGAGIVDGSDASDKAAGIDINVWTGIGMLALGLFMLAWMVLSPTAVAAKDGEDDETDGDSPRRRG